MTNVLLLVAIGFLSGALGIAFFFWIARPKSPISKWNARKDPAYNAWLEMNREDRVLYYVVREGVSGQDRNARCRCSSFYLRRQMPELLAELAAQREDDPENVTYGIGAIFCADPRLFGEKK